MRAAGERRAQRHGGSLTRFLSLVAAMLMVVASLGSSPAPRRRHDRRPVGPYNSRWLADEPAFAGLMNGLDLSVTDARSGKG